MLRKSIKKSLAISLAGMALPFLLGCGTSYILYQYIEPVSHRESNSFVSYLLFLGVAMAITAFPVLARILTELNLLKTKVGSITISAAAVDDATSWCLLALVISIINANSNLTALYVFLMGVGYSALLIMVIRPIFVWTLRFAGVFNQETPSQVSMFFALMLVFISAFITDAIGIHAIFGGFIAGIIMPHERGFAYHITEKLEDVVQILFLPLYFALSGLKTKIGTLDDPLSWAVVLLVVIAACLGKIIGCCLAARMTNLTWRESFTVGALMNCKGLVELIVLNLGYDSGVISDKTFAIMVIMALVTTFITVPMVTCIYPQEYQVAQQAKREEERAEGGHRSKKESSLLVSVNRIEQVGPLLSIVHLLQQKMNYVKELHQEEQRKGSRDSGKSFASLVDILNILPGTGGGKSGGKVKIQNCRGSGVVAVSTGVVINVLRLIELTERDSSVMLSASQSALSNDPITKLLKTFCEVTNKKNRVEGMVKVVTMPMFGRVLAQAGEQANAEYILVPWSGSGSIVEDNPPVGRPMSLVAAASRRRHSIHTPTQHSNFFQDLLSEAKKSNVVIFVDRGGPVVTADLPPMREGGSDDDDGSGHEIPDVSRKQIYLPFFGGKDDREALRIVMGLGHLPHIRINVIRYKNVPPERQSTISGTASLDGTGEKHDTVYCAAPVGQQLDISMDEKDEALIQHYFGGSNPKGGKRGSTSGSGGGGGSCPGGGCDEENGDVVEHPEEEDEEEHSVQYSEVECFNPVSKALQYLVHLTGSDLVMFGRGNMKLGDSLGIHYRYEIAERRKILGDFAEAVMLCHCSASLLVVNAIDDKYD